MSLVTLPTELRHELYSYLTSVKKTGLPFNDYSILTISHKPPPSTLQRSCRFLYHDITAYFYSIATIKVAYCARSLVNNPRSLAAIRRAETVEFMMLSIEDDEGVFPVLECRMERWTKYIVCEMDMIRVLCSEGKCLKKLVVTLDGRFEDEEGQDMKDARMAQLKELKDLNGGVTFVVGHVGYFSEPYPDLRMEVEKYVEGLNAKRA